jgi:hypothetical protein
MYGHPVIGPKFEAHLSRILIKYVKCETEEFGGVLCDYIILPLVFLIPTLS